MHIEIQGPLLVGNEIIDGDHKELASLINAFYDSVEAGADRQKIYDEVDTLSLRFAEHMDKEKAMIAKYRFPDAENHLAEHTKLLGELGGFLYRVDEANDNDLPNVARFIDNWFTSHIITSDAKIAKFLNDQENKATR